MKLNVQIVARGHHPSPAKSCLTYTSGKSFEATSNFRGPAHRQPRQYIGSEVLQGSLITRTTASRSGQSSPDGFKLFEAREREDSVALQFPPSSQPSPRASLLSSRTAVRYPLHKSVALSDPALVRGIPARVQLQAAVRDHDTIPRSQFLAHHWRLDVPAHTA